MAELKDKTKNGLFWSGLMSLMQQVFGLAFSIIIARKLNPSDYGMVGMLTIFTAVATCLQDGGLVWALTNRKEVSNLQYSSIFWFNVIASVFIYGILFLCAPLIADFFNHYELIWLSRYIFLGLVFSSLGMVHTAFLYKEIKVKERAISTIVGIIVAGVVGIILAYNGFSYWGIATQGILNIGITTFMLWIFSPFRPSLKIDWGFLKSIILEGIKFVIPNIFAIVGENVFSVILGKKYSVNDVGNFTQASKWNTTGYSIILGMMRNVSQPVLVQVRDNKQQYLNVFRKLYRMTAFLIIPVMFGLSMVAPEFIEIILTSKWLESATILRVLCIGGCIGVLNSMFTYFIMSLNRTNLYMYLGIGMSIIHVVSALIASNWGAMALAYTYTLISFVSFILYYMFIRQTHPYNLSMLIEDLAPILVITICSLLFSYYLTIDIDNAIIRLISRITISVCLYIGLMQIFNCDSYMEIKSFLLHKIKRN